MTRGHAGCMVPPVWLSQSRIAGKAGVSMPLRDAPTEITGTENIRAESIRTDPDPTAKLAVTRLTLTRFRCYEGARLNADARPVVLTGPNGAGKTNLLEAVSFLSPGRGLRRAKLADVERIGGADEAGQGSVQGVGWAVAARVET